MSSTTATLNSGSGFKPIILYDIPGNAAPDVCWSPNVWKVRFALNVKRIPHITHCVHFPSIASTCLSLSPPAPPTSTNPDGTPHYTVPFIHDPNTNTTVSESINIAMYLDKTYPNPPGSSTFPGSADEGEAANSTPILVPHGTIALQTLFVDTLLEKVTPLMPLVLPAMVLQLPEPSQSYYRARRERQFGKKVEEFLPPIDSVAGKKTREALVARTVQGLNEVDGWMKANDYDGLAKGIGNDEDEDEGSLFVMGGSEPRFADLVIVALLASLRRMVGDGSEVWETLMGASGGRWRRMVERCRKWEVVDEEGIMAWTEGEGKS